MTLITTVRDVCAVVGVAAPVSVLANISTNRTMFEMLATANEMAQRIAYDTRDWTELIAAGGFMGSETDPVGAAADPLQDTSYFRLPANYKRLLLTTNIRRRSSPQRPLRFISDADEWIERRLSSETNGVGEWALFHGYMYVHPLVPADDELRFVYLQKNCINLASGGHGDRFASDDDTFRLDERLLKLGMIYDWKMKKGSPYAEDMGTYSDAIATAMGRDKPSPIYIGGQAMPDLWGGHAFY